MAIIKVSPNNVITKKLENWTNRDFLFHFANKIKETTGNELNIPPVAWPGFLGRIKGFRKKLGLNNHDYKEFMDNVFEQLFVGKDYVPTFGSIVSEKTFNVLKHYSPVATATSNDDFVKLREALYKDVCLFIKRL